MYASVCSLRLDEIDPSVYEQTKIFHISSITLALDPQLREVALEVIRKFKEADIEKLGWI